MEDAHVFDLIPGYALGILEKSEVEQVEKHLALCAVCRQELQSYRQVIDKFPLAMKISAPPDDLKDKILAQVKEERRSQAFPQAEPFWAQVCQTLRNAAPVWGVISLVMVLLLLISNLILWQQLGKTEQANQRKMIGVALIGEEAAPQATGMLVMSADGEDGVLVVDHLPQLRPEQQYQLWLIQDGQRTSGGVFSVNEEGYGSLMISSPQPINSFNAVGITIEPAGGSPGPTGKKVMGGEI
jgi:anti-sigma-K factor RskA